MQEWFMMNQIPVWIQIQMTYPISSAFEAITLHDSKMLYLSSWSSDSTISHHHSSQSHSTQAQNMPKSSMKARYKAKLYQITTEEIWNIFQK